MASAFHVALRLLQLMSSILVLGLSAYLVHHFTDVQRQNIPTALDIELDLLVAISTFSLLTIYCLEFLPYFGNIVLNPYHEFFAEAAVAGLYFGTFIALAVSVSKLYKCTSPLCAAARADTVFAALSYTAWITSATAKAMRVSHRNKEEHRAGYVREDMEKNKA
ncbi:hypothetical protein BP5796_12961 [Coleophoma crateriformis]|uniref:MARVEL domain-containing protein n=1 Tax=Coleophoma crateriformis TaxID=565419 RepID=A0A3D8Q656_9HELO|nr:hypothetical protein BP5796_12961 [Coleophoma crateriformis]